MGHVMKDKFDLIEDMIARACDRLLEEEVFEIEGNELDGGYVETDVAITEIERLAKKIKMIIAN